jgi:hypothetical protein
VAIGAAGSASIEMTWRAVEVDVREDRSAYAGVPPSDHRFFLL